MANYQRNMRQILSAASQNTISINGAQGALTNPWQNLATSSISSTEIDWGNEPHVKKYQVVEIEEDLLALSCTWQRLRSPKYRETAGPYVSVSRLTDSVLLKHIEQEDHVKAAQVRDYYSKKIMLWKLKGEKLSAFREDMNSFIHTEGKVFKEIMMPLVYRLPEFYDYDSDFDTLSNDYNKKVTQSTQVTAGIKSLKLAKTFAVGKRYTKRKEYWFSDDNNDLVTFSLTHDNPLLSLLDMYAQNPIKLDAIYTKKYRDNNEYLIANKFKFL